MNRETAGSAPPLDLTNCDREPIHVPGAIQPHGALLVLREPELTIRRASANAPELLGVPPSSLLGAPLAAVLGPVDNARVSAAVRAARLDGENPIPIELGGRRFHGILHRRLGNTLFELEPAVASEGAAAVHPVHGAVTRLGAARGIHDLRAILVESVRALTGFARRSRRSISVASRSISISIGKCSASARLRRASRSSPRPARASGARSISSGRS